MKWDNSFNGIEYYSNVKSSSVEWIWYPYIPCGKITVLQGDPGEGKSTLILHIAAILTKGANLPDGNKIKKPMTVIYQCSEDSKADTIKPRLENAGADCRRVAFIKDDNGDLTLDDERIELAVKTTGAKLLVLDPIQAFIGKNGNMQSAVRTRETMTKLANIAEEYTCAIVLVGHMTKSNSGKSIYRGLGSIDIAAAARSVLLVARDKDEPYKRYMLPIKSSLAPEGEPIAFALDRDNGFSWIGKCEININELGDALESDSDIDALNVLNEFKGDIFSINYPCLWNISETDTGLLLAKDRSKNGMDTTGLLSVIFPNFSLMLSAADGSSLRAEKTSLSYYDDKLNKSTYTLEEYMYKNIAGMLNSSSSYLNISMPNEIEEVTLMGKKGYKADLVLTINGVNNVYYTMYFIPYDSENLITVIKACNESEKNTVYENALDKALNSLKLS